MLYLVRVIKDKNNFKGSDFEMNVFGTKIFDRDKKDIGIYKNLLKISYNEIVDFSFVTDKSEYAFSSIVSASKSTGEIIVTFINDDCTKLFKYSINNNKIIEANKDYLSKEYIKMTARAIKKGEYDSLLSTLIDSAIIPVDSAFIAGLINKYSAETADADPMNFKISEMDDEGKLKAYIGDNTLFIDYYYSDTVFVTCKVKVEDLYSKSSAKTIYNFIKEIRR